MGSRTLTVQELWMIVATLAGFLVIGLGIGWLVGMSLAPVIADLIGNIVALIILLLTALAGLEKATPASTDPPTGLATVFSGWRFNPWPLAMLMVGLFIGTYAGNRARVQDIFAEAKPTAAQLATAQLEAEIAPWVAQGMSQAMIAQRLFDGRFPRAGGAATPLTMEQLQAEMEPWLSQGLSQTVVVQRLFDLNYPEEGVTVDFPASPAAPAAAPSMTNPNQTGLFGVSAEAEDNLCANLLTSTNELRGNIGDLEIRSLHVLSDTIDDNQMLWEVVSELCKPDGS